MTICRDFTEALIQLVMKLGGLLLHNFSQLMLEGPFQASMVSFEKNYIHIFLRIKDLNYFPEPEMKAKFKISIARPKHLVSLSNMPKEKEVSEMIG